MLNVERSTYKPEVRSTRNPEDSNIHTTDLTLGLLSTCYSFQTIDLLHNTLYDRVECAEIKGNSFNATKTDLEKSR